MLVDAATHDLEEVVGTVRAPSRQDLARLRARDRVPEEPWQIAGEARAEPEVLPEWHDPSR
jgi:hypothetical protein